MQKASVLPKTLDSVVLPKNLPPLILIAFKRPDALRSVLEALAEQTLIPSQLIVYLDGPRKKEDGSKVEECAKLLGTYPNLNITLKRRERNFGCAANILHAVKEVLEEYEEVIILEDDLIPAPAFYETMCRLLIAYQPISQVFSVSCFAPYYYCPSAFKKILSDAREDFFVTNNFACWGWGIWRDRWDAVSGQVMNGKIPYKGLFELPIYQHTKDLVRIYYENRKKYNDEWVHLMSYHALYQNQVMICPLKSLIYNVKPKPSDATHMTNPDVSDRINLYYDPSAHPNTLPKNLELHPALKESLSRKERLIFFLNDFSFIVWWSGLRALIGEKQFERFKIFYCSASKTRWYYWLLKFPKKVLAAILVNILTCFKSKK